MKEKYIKIVQCDRRGQLVIPQNIRRELNIKEGAGFWIYKANDVICLKKIESPKPKDLKK